MDTAEKHLARLSPMSMTTPTGSISPPSIRTPWFRLAHLTADRFQREPVALSRPVAAFFSADSTKAYILSCGLECGGASASTVTEIDTTSISPAPRWSPVPLTPGRPSPPRSSISGRFRRAHRPHRHHGQHALRRRSPPRQIPSRFHCRRTGGTTCRTATSPSSISPPERCAHRIRIGNGVKRRIRNVNGVFWVGSINCGVQSCVSMVNPAAGTPASVLANANGDATGIAFQANSGEIYTIEGGELLHLQPAGAADHLAVQHRHQGPGRSTCIYIN